MYICADTHTCAPALIDLSLLLVTSIIDSHSVESITVTNKQRHH